VLCVLEDTMTKAERTLASAGKEDSVLRVRHELQNAMRNDLTAAVEEFTHRKVVAFLSANHVEPDLSAELFVLEEPFAETADVSVPLGDSRRTERRHDGPSQIEESR
jgi:uncharacterized protein YbcI